MCVARLINFADTGRFKTLTLAGTRRCVTVIDSLALRRRRDKTPSAHHVESWMRMDDRATPVTRPPNQRLNEVQA